MSKSFELAWLPIGEPLPEGWRLAEDPDRPTHHNHYARLVRRDIEEEEDGTAGADDR